MFQEKSVIFRKFKTYRNRGLVFAIFPYEQEFDDYQPLSLVKVFDPVLDWDWADYDYILKRSAPATPEEYSFLLKQLEKQGLKLKIIKKAQRKKMKR